MKIDYKIISAVSFFFVLALGIVFTLRAFEVQRTPVGGQSRIDSAHPPKKSGEKLAERIQPASGATADHIIDGMILSINKNELKMIFPNCETTSYSDMFFLHVYQKENGKVDGENYINMDFDIKNEAISELTYDGGKACVIEKKFSSIAVGELTFGQFRMPNGKCCELIWSRTYVFD